jgi:hypothetical protein
MSWQHATVGAGAARNHRRAEARCDPEPQQSWSVTVPKGLIEVSDDITVSREITEDERTTMFNECFSGFVTVWGIPAVWLLTLLVVPTIYLRRWRSLPEVRAPQG